MGWQEADAERLSGELGSAVFKREAHTEKIPQGRREVGIAFSLGLVSLYLNSE